MRIFALVTLLLVAACQKVEAPAPDHFALPRFGVAPTWQVNAVRLQLEPSDAIFTPDSVEPLTPISFSDSVKQWAEDRFRLAGSEGALVVTIDRAAISEAALPKTAGIKGSFTNEQSERYQAELAVTVALYSGGALSDAKASVEAKHAVTVAEDATVVDRERAIYRLMTIVIQKIDAEMNKQVALYFSKPPATDY